LHTEAWVAASPANSQPAMALGWSKQNWVEIFRSSGLERPDTGVLEYMSLSKRLQAGTNEPLNQIRPRDATTDWVPGIGHF
jgi:hypothetical protein